MQLLTNHIGYDRHSSKQAVLMLTSNDAFDSVVDLIDSDSKQSVAKFHLGLPQQVDNWHQGQFCAIDFSTFTQVGRYYLQCGEVQSHPFEISTQPLLRHTLSDLLHYFKSQRCSGVFDQKDRQVPLLDSRENVDVHGGWYDASGDVSKYFSHLSYANYLNPQQIPMLVWNLLKGLTLAEQQADVAPFTNLRMTEEALFGADFLVRMQSPHGYFYTTVFDKWSKETKQREICAYQTQQGHKSADYQAGFRQGAGIAIAALARAARLQQHGEFTQAQYLQAALTGYHHLAKHNVKYLDDGQENIIDEYCALLAATELYRCTQDDEFLVEAQQWAHLLSARQQSDDNFNHFWSADQEGSRPYFHAAEAGLPVIALCEYLTIESDSSQKKLIQRVVENALRFELTITQQVANPFHYPRQYIKGVNEVKRSAFFIAQNNESGYWWQGENARLASLASMAYLAAVTVSDKELRQALHAYANSALNWIVGLNPYDICMLDGHGHNNPNYLPQLGFFNAKGGVCNGITAGFDDEHDIAFNPADQKDDMLQNWRWGEQWLPHGAWFLLAILSQAYVDNTISNNVKQEAHV